MLLSQRGSPLRECLEIRLTDNGLTDFKGLEAFQSYQILTTNRCKLLKIRSCFEFPNTLLDIFSLPNLRLLHYLFKRNLSEYCLSVHFGNLAVGK